jgi:hypothetical protein
LLTGFNFRAIVKLEVFISSDWIDPINNVPKLFAALPDACPLLSTLSIDIEDDEVFSFDYAVIQPVLGRLSLQHFSLSQPLLPFCLSQRDVINIAKALGPSIEVLDLNHDPYNIPFPITTAHTPVLTLSAIVPFAQHCPRLKVLRLFVDATSATSPSNAVAFRSGGCELHLGCSPTDNIQPVISFLHAFGNATVCNTADIRTSEPFNEAWDGIGSVLVMLRTRDTEIEKQRSEIEGLRRKLEDGFRER